MFYCVSSNLAPLSFRSAGLFQSNEPFVHTHRNLDSFVLLLGMRETLYITQDGQQRELGPDQYMLLFPGHDHYGHLLCEPGLSYYWAHFQFGDRHELVGEEDVQQRLLLLWQEGQSESSHNIYLLPEFGSIVSGERTSHLFRQLIDLSQRNNYSVSLENYAMSMLAMEITQQFVNESQRRESAGQPHYNIIEIMEWIRVNCHSHLTVKGVADVFGYNPNYLSTVFKRFTGQPLLKYINKMRISASKQLLLNSKISVKAVAAQVGFEDEKHYMKLFRQFEDMTPTQYRNLYFRKHLNKK